MVTKVENTPALAKQFAEFMAQFNDIFVGREHAVRLVTYALLQRQHVLFFGPPGTSKTALCDTVFNAITGATTFSMEFTKFMGEDAIFGAYDVRRMREDGVLEHRIDGMLPQAQLARFGEFLDANDPLLRSTLGALNERRMMRGTQRMQMPLMTAYCDTNKDPGDYIRQNPDSFAVLDRILFLDRLDYLDDEVALGEMVSRFQRGVIREASITIPIDVIIQLSSLIVTPPGLINDRTISDTYAKAVIKYRAKRDKMSEDQKRHFILPQISDRRVNLASQMLESEAVLNGRLHVEIGDMRAAGTVLCTSKPEMDIWNAICDEVIPDYERMNKARLKNSQSIALTAIEEQLERDVIKAPAGANGDDSHVFQVLLQQFRAIVPDDPEVEEVKQRLEGRFREALALLRSRKLQANGLADDI